MSIYCLNQQENTKRFYELAEKLDQLLGYFSNSIYIINNSNVHLPRNHPEYLYIWKPVIYKRVTNTLDSIKISLIFLLSIYKTILEIVSNLFLKNYKITSEIQNKEIDYLFVSHRLDSNNSDSDFYYGDILTYLSISGNHIIRLLIPHSRNSITLNKTINYKSILLDQKMNMFKLWSYLIHNFIAIVQLLFYCRKKRFTYYETIALVIGQINNFSNYRLTVNIERIASQFTIKKLVMTFEGNTIEKSIFYLCNKYKIRSYGYQHAPIIKDQNTIFRYSTPTLSPHVVLASGPYTYSIFLQKLKDKTTVKLLGSPKSTSERLNALTNQARKKGTILLVPDGNVKSIIKFCNAGQDLARKDNDLFLKIRSHPLFMSSLTQQMKTMKIDTKFFISTNSLKQDLEEADWVIYENSSVAIQALFYYCKLIYFKNELSNVDPLFDLTTHKFTAGHVNEIYTTIKKNKNSNVLEFQNSLDFGNKYFSPLDYTVLF